MSNSLRRQASLLALVIAATFAAEVVVSARGIPDWAYKVTKIDWRQRGAVTPVYTQGPCANDFVIAAVESIEGQSAVGGRKLQQFAVQQVMDCFGHPNLCNDPHMPQSVWRWLLSSARLPRAPKGSIDTAASYPYNGTGVVNTCNVVVAGNPKNIGAHITGWEFVARNESVMTAWVAAHGPLVVMVDGTSFVNYFGGLYTDCTDGPYDHSVLVVGFDDDHNPPYWIIKNSWGPSFGENGYIRVAKGSNQCNITSMPMSAVVNIH